MIDINPRISFDGLEMTITSRIHFKMLPESGALAKQLLADCRAQVLPPGPHDRYLVWPLTSETAVMEITHFGAIADSATLLDAHKLYAKAHLDAFGTIAGSPSLAEGADFDSADPVR